MVRWNGELQVKPVAEFRPISAWALGPELDQFRDQVVKLHLAPRRPKVSIMLITYNHEKYIAQALDSLLMQETEYDFEINVIEDCSTDRTQEIVMQYVRKYPHIVKPYFNAKNIGYKVTQKNFYRGFFTLTGDYLAILEGDDYWSSPHRLQKQVAFLEANPDFAICACNTVKIYEDGSKEPHRFLYWGRQADGTLEDAINLRTFFHTAGLMYRNVFKGIPPRHYQNKWSCDIFVLISHAEFGKVRHIDEDMAVYRAHGDGRFSGMSSLDGWIFNIDGLRRYNGWLGYRHCRAFANSISGYCRYVLVATGKGGVVALSRYQHVRIRSIYAFYRSLYHALDLPRKARSLVARFRTTRLNALPKLRGLAEWDLIWFLKAKAVEDGQVVADQPVIELTALPAVSRHAVGARFRGFLPGSKQRVTLWIKPIDDTNVHIQLRDSIVGFTGKAAHECDVWFDLSSQTVRIRNGDVVDAGIEPATGGWSRAWVDFVTGNGQIYACLGLVKGTTNSHVFRGEGERILFGGAEICLAPIQ
jgi:glycosyltransferase involved in cell wall biosynthesis